MFLGKGTQVTFLERFGGDHKLCRGGGGGSLSILGSQVMFLEGGKPKTCYLGVVGRQPKVRFHGAGG